VKYDDLHLVKLVLSGQSEAFGQLVARYQDRLFTAMVSVARTPSEAEDVVQEAMVQAFTKLASFQNESSFYTWLYRIAFNQAMTMRRRKEPQASLDDTKAFSQSQPVAPSTAVDGPMLLDEQVAVVRQAIAQLADEFRSVLVLREIDGCDYEQISQILDLPVGTVRSRLHRARLQLKLHLEQLLPDEQRW
jgi:RNA polymerase sigma-70 factor, ECF subfamily